MTAARRRAPLIAAALATGILALSATGTAALTATGDPALAIFDREPTADERAKAEQLDSRSFFYFDEKPEVRLLLAAPSADAPDAQDVWALRLDGPVFDIEQTAVCLLTSRRGTEQEFLAGCLPAEVVARRGFVPLDEPRPFLFVDGEELLIEWGPTGDARLIPRPAPPAPATEVDEPGSDS